MRAIVLAAAIALAGCQLDEPMLGGTVLSVTEAERGDPLDYLEQSARHYDDPLVPEVGWRVEVLLDGGREVTVTHDGTRRYAPGDRVRLLVDEDGALLL